MKLTRSLLAIVFSLSLVLVSSLTLTIQSVSAQESKVALQRGFRTGYSDGYMSGYRDSIENANKSYERHTEYKSADRAYTSEYGNKTQYKDGYQQGFEKGYDTGYEKRSFDATIPSTLVTRGVVAVKDSTGTTVETIKTATTLNKDVAVTTAKGQVTATAAKITPATGVTAATVTQATVDKMSTTNVDAPSITQTEKIARTKFRGDEIIIIPASTELVVELDRKLDTREIREGDSFTARVVSPIEIEGAFVEGRVVRNSMPGRIKKRAELLLSFDRIKLSESRWSNFNAIIVEVLPMKGDNVKRTDDEGVVEGTRPFKKDTLTIGGATGAGAIIGAVVGGPVGAAVGAGVGAAFGVGAVVVERGQWIVLQEDQQLRIRSAYETQIR